MNSILSMCPTVSPPWEGIAIPDGYELTAEGVIEFNEKGEARRIAGPVWLSAHTHDESLSHYGLVLCFVDLRGNLTEYPFRRDALHEQGRSLVQNLAVRGLEIVPGQEPRLSRYIGAFNAKGVPWLRSTARVGWIDAADSHLAYVYPSSESGVIALETTERIVFQPEQYSPNHHAMHQQGRLQDWQTYVALPCRGNPYLITAVCMPFAAMLLKAAAVESGGIHYYGRSSRGKTTAAQVAASVVGCGADPASAPALAYVQRWNSTANGLEGLSAAHNDSLLILDEIHTCGAKDFGQVAYNIAGGKGKAVMDKDRNLKQPRTWRTFVFSSGETSVRQKIEQEGNKVHAGQLVRLADVPINDSLIQDTHGMEPDAFALQLKRACAQHYGTAGPAFIKALIERFHYFHPLTAHVKRALAEAEARLAVPRMEAEQRRTLRRFALIEAAGKLAVEFGILPFTEQEIEDAVTQVVKAWRAEGVSMPDRIRGVMALQEFIQRHPRRFRPAHDSAICVNDLSGYTERLPQGGCLYMFTPEGFAEACGGHNLKDIAREIQKLGFLHTNEKDRYMYKCTVVVNGESKRLRLYAVSDAILEFDPTDESPTSSEFTGIDGTGGAAE